MKVLGGLHVSGDSRFYSNLEVNSISSNASVSASTFISGNTNISNILDGKKANVISVAKSGGTFTDIKTAVDWANANVTDRTEIVIAPGEYEIGETITANNVNLTGIIGAGKRETRLIPLGTLPGTPFFILSSNTRVSSIDFYCDDLPAYKSTIGSNVIEVYGNSGYFFESIRMSQANKGFHFYGNSSMQFVTLSDILINGVKTGIVLDNGVGVTIPSTFISIDCDEHIVVKNSLNQFQTQLRIISGARIQGPNSGIQSGTGITLNNESRLILSNGILEILNEGLIIDGNSIAEIYSGNLEDCKINGLNQLDTGSTITFSGTRIQSSGLTTVNLSNVSGYIQNNDEGDKGLSVFEELRVGLPGLGKESVFGEGDSYTKGIMALLYNGSTTAVSDITEEISTLNNIGTEFPTNTLDSAIYLTTKINDKSGNPLPFFGFKLSILSGAVLGSGNIDVEFWDGSSWEAVNHLITMNDNHLPKANDKFTISGSQQLRLDERLESNWAINDPLSLGFSSYWIRLRITSDISSSPSFDQIKLHTNRTEINGDGFLEFFGDARPIKTFPLSYASVTAAANSPANTDMYISDNLFSGRLENNFQNGVTDQSGFINFLPSDIDTSSPITVHMLYRGSSNAAGDVDFSINWGWVTSGSAIFTSTGAAPSIGPNEQSINRVFSVPATSNAIVLQETFTLELPEAIGDRGFGEIGDVLFITFTRQGAAVADTYAGNVQIIDAGGFYSAWNNGGHIQI